VAGALAPGLREHQLCAIREERGLLDAPRIC